MTFQSMTGFARNEGRIEAEAGPARWAWEIRSVNARGLDMRLRLPSGFEAIEVDCRKIIGAAVTRGSIQANLRYDRENGGEVPAINHAALEAVLGAVEELRRRIGSPPPAAEAILSLRGVLETASGEDDEKAVAERNAVVLDGLRAAMEDLVSARAGEGEQIVALLSGQIDEIARLTAAVEADESRSPDAIRERIATQLAPLLDEATLDPQRLHHEAALLATRADLREEIDRLNGHVEAARTLLASGEPVGRKLDFLAQEFNRECNTICSKSNAASVTTLGLDMKAVIDQFREQVQNLE